MKKIDQETSEAFWSMNDYRNRNTSVLFRDGVSTLYLFGYPIAIYKHESKELWIDPCGWYTRTTANRLNAVLPDGFIVHKKGEHLFLHRQYDDGEKVQLNGKTKVL